MITVLVPESDLPAEGADAEALAAGNDPTASDLLATCSELLASSSATFSVSADGEVSLDGSDDGQGLLALEISGEGGAEPNVILASEEPRCSVDLASAANSVTGSFDADDGVRQLVGNLASQLRQTLGSEGGAPVPLVRWIQPEDSSGEEEGGRVAQLLGIWLANDEQLEALRGSGNEGIIFDADEVEGRGLRETLTTITVLGVMMGSSVTADAGIFSRRASKAKPVATKTVDSNRQAPARVDRSALQKVSSSETSVIVDVSRQRAYLLADGEVVVDTPVSTARAGKHTPRGEFKITQRVKHGKKSTIYGCDLPYWMRLNQSAIGMHIGDLPGYPASAGCIRLPAEIAPIMFEMTKSGTTVKVVDSWQPQMTVASR